MSALLFVFCLPKFSIVIIVIHVRPDVKASGLKSDRLRSGEGLVKRRFLTSLDFGAKAEKLQTPRSKLQRNIKLQDPKEACASEAWCLEFGASLEFGSWC